GGLMRHDVPGGATAFRLASLAQRPGVGPVREGREGRRSLRPRASSRLRLTQRPGAGAPQSEAGTRPDTAPEVGRRDRTGAATRGWTPRSRLVIATGSWALRRGWAPQPWGVHGRERRALLDAAGTRIEEGSDRTRHERGDVAAEAGNLAHERARHERMR